MLRRLAGFVVVGAFTLGVTAAYAGVDPKDLCRAKKEMEVGKYAVGLTKEFGKNAKKVDTGKLSAGISKAQSKISKGFTKAEWKGNGDPKGCDTTGDVAALQAKGDAVVADIIDELTPPPACGTLQYTTSAPVGTCGRINDATDGSGTDLDPFPADGNNFLKCGDLMIGGGGSVQAPSPTPDNGLSIFNITDCASDTAMVLAPTTSSDTGSTRTCTTGGCTYGAPLPIPNTGTPSVSTCVINTIAATPTVGGTLNAVTGTASITLPLTSTVYATGDLDTAKGGVQPCPECISGTCTTGPNAGSACTPGTSLNTSHDCPPPAATVLPSFGVDLSPLGNGTVSMSGSSGNFCSPTPGQRTNGCFGQGTCQYIEENGSPAGDLTGGSANAAVLSSVFCIPATGNALINAIADLPGPGATSLPGTAQIVP